MTTGKTIIKSSDVTDCLRFLVTMSGYFETDDEHYVTNANGDRISTDVNGEQVPVLLFQEVIKDPKALVVNPFHEGLQDTQSQAWFYIYQHTFFMVAFDSVVEFLLKSALSHKSSPKAAKGKAAEVPKLPLGVTKAISPIIESVDDKVLEEYKKLMDATKPRDILTVYYRKQQRTSVVSCPIIAGDFEAYAAYNLNIRKKTYEVLKTLFMSVLGISSAEELEQYNVKATATIHCPKLESQLRCYFGLYNQINQYLEYTVGEHNPINLDIFAKHLDNIPQYHTIAKWQKSPVAPATAEVPKTTTSGVPQPANAGPQPWNPAPTVVPGRTATGVPVPAGMQVPMVPQQMVAQYPQNGMMGYPQQQPMMYAPPQQPMAVGGVLKAGYPQNNMMMPQMQMGMPNYGNMPMMQMPGQYAGVPGARFM